MYHNDLELEIQTSYTPNICDYGGVSFLQGDNLTFQHQCANAQMLQSDFYGNFLFNLFHGGTQ